MSTTLNHQFKEKTSQAENPVNGVSMLHEAKTVPLKSMKTVRRIEAGTVINIYSSQ